LTVSSFSSAAVRKTGQAKLPITAIDIAAIAFFIGVLLKPPEFIVAS
jgi:hypothetical protein